MKRTTATLICLIIVMMLGVTIEAKTARNGKYMDAQGHIYIMRGGKPRTGYFRYHGRWYYGHKTSSPEYPRGSVTVGQIRIKSRNHWYAFGADGKRIERDQYIRKGRTRSLKSLDIRSRNRTVRYVYGTSRVTLGTRYSTSEMRMQYQDDQGRWVTMAGMPFVPDYVDQQK